MHIYRGTPRRPKAAGAQVRPPQSVHSRRPPPFLVGSQRVKHTIALETESIRTHTEVLTMWGRSACLVRLLQCHWQKHALLLETRTLKPLATPVAVLHASCVDRYVVCIKLEVLQLLFTSLPLSLWCSWISYLLSGFVHSIWLLIEKGFLESCG